MIRSSEQALPSGEIRSAWAIWLLGVFIVYGLAVRITLLIFCWLKWGIACRHLKINTDYVEYQTMVKELETVAVKSIVDEDSYQKPYYLVNNYHAYVHGTKKVLVAMDIEESWVPPDNIEFLGFLNNSEQRNQVLDFLQQHPAEKLLIAIDTNRSPDRGMINLIYGLIQKSAQSKLWFINHGRQYNNWQESLVKLDIQDVDASWLLK